MDEQAPLVRSENLLSSYCYEGKQRFIDH